MTGLSEASQSGQPAADYATNAQTLATRQEALSAGTRKQPVNFSDLSPVEQGKTLRALDLATGDTVTSNQIVADGDAPPAVEPEVHTCTVEVRYTPVALGANHAFIVTTDADSQMYYRGGPAANSEGLNSPSGSSSGSSAPEFDPNQGIYGSIVTEYGEYRPGTIDWTTEPSGQQTVDVSPGNCDAVDHDLAQAMDDIEAAEINYMPLHQNSNSTVREGLERAGFDDVEPVVWAPAWNTQLRTP